MRVVHQHEICDISGGMVEEEKLAKEYKIPIVKVTSEMLGDMEPMKSDLILVPRTYWRHLYETEDFKIEIDELMNESKRDKKTIHELTQALGESNDRSCDDCYFSLNCRTRELRPVEENMVIFDRDGKRFESFKKEEE